MPNETELTQMLTNVSILTPGLATTAVDTTYLGGTPLARAGTPWPGQMTFLGRFGFAGDRWEPGNERWLSVFFNEQEGYVEWGETDHVTVWTHGANEDLVRLDAPDNVRVLPARGVSLEPGKELPYDKRLGDWQWDSELDNVRRRLTGGNSGQHSQLGGYPTVYGGYESFDLMENPGDYELALKLNGHPLRAHGVEVAIHDVLNIYFHPKSGEFFSDMQR